MTGAALLTSGPADATAHLVLAHGAGAPMTSPFMTALCDALAAAAIRTTRFEFAYMAARRNDGGRRPPPPAERLADEYRALVAGLPPVKGQRLAIGGKSMGGRVASMVADELRTAGAVHRLVCVGYPFHPPRQPERLRTAHLERLACPALFVQGTRDPLGNEGEVVGYRLSDAISLVWLSDGDHDLEPRRASGHTHAQHITAAAGAIAAFLAAP